MSSALLSPAVLPPSDLEGLDPQWSRLVHTPELDGVGRTWHVLDNQEPNPTLTLLCVHGNPTWSYLWRNLVANAPSGIRVVAIDHLDMGFSERTGTTRRLAQRVDDLCELTEELGIEGPVVTVAHDWGGPISIGWAERHTNQLAGIVLMNTAVHQPDGSPAPSLIRTVRTRGILDKVCMDTPLFIKGTMALSRGRIDKNQRRAYAAPYGDASRRAAIATFVEDIPLDDAHPSHDALASIAAGLDDLADVPALLLWGPSDPVFSDLYLRDLSQRLPHAEIHRFIGASHLLPEDANVEDAVYSWVESLGNEPEVEESAPDRDSMWAAIDARSNDAEVAIVEMEASGVARSVSFADLSSDIRNVAAGLADIGVRNGDRVSLLVPPGIDLAVCLYASWRIGAVVVLLDAGLGARGMGRALQSANPAYIIGIPKAVGAARALRWPGVRISTAPLSPTQARVLGADHTLASIRDRGITADLPSEPSSDDLAAIAFTSGATGPAKGVVYRHRQVQAQRDALVDLYEIAPDDSLVAAFGPFALFGPAMGIPSAVPDMKVTAPGSLTAAALADAIDAVKASIVFGSPAALRSIAATATELSATQSNAMSTVRVLVSAGAPVPASVLKAAGDLMSNAESYTPYGMTEVLPVASISLSEIIEAGAGNGVCVGFPVDGADVMISPLDATGNPSGALTADVDILGEICIRAAHMREGYDNLWVTERAASQPEGWHRSGDVGHYDAEGRLWVEGRIGHIVATAAGVVTPVGIEHAVATLPDVTMCAVVGIGPRGTQQVAVVVVPSHSIRKPGLAKETLIDQVREIAGAVDIAVVLEVPSLPVDKRHNSKIDRPRVARWASDVLAGGRMKRL